MTSAWSSARRGLHSIGEWRPPPRAHHVPMGWPRGRAAIAGHKRSVAHSRQNRNHLLAERLPAAGIHASAHHAREDGVVVPETRVHEAKTSWLRISHSTRAGSRSGTVATSFGTTVAPARRR